MKIYFYFDDFLKRPSRKMNGITMLDRKFLYYKNEDSMSYFPHNLISHINAVSEDYTENYFYPLYFSCFMISENDKFFTDNNVCIELPKKVQQDITKNKVKILIFSIFEGPNLNTIDTILKKKLLDPYNLNINNIKLITGSYASRTPLGIENVYFNDWENIYDHYINNDNNLLEDSIASIFSKEHRKNKFICLQRRPNSQRLALFAELFEYQSEGILTMGTGDAGHNDNIDSMTQNSAYQKSFELFHNKNLKNTLPLEYDVTLSKENPVFDVYLDKYKSAYLHIVSETVFENTSERYFFSEKIYKPVLFLQPFVVFNRSGSLKKLKQFGFKTFDSIIDESYDNIKNDDERFYSAVNSIKKYLKKDTRKIHKDMRRIFPILIHNYYNLKLRNKDTLSQLLLYLKELQH